MQKLGSRKNIVIKHHISGIWVENLQLICVDHDKHYKIAKAFVFIFGPSGKFWNGYRFLQRNAVQSVHGFSGTYTVTPIFSLGGLYFFFRNDECRILL
jgi:hypothetical protein